MSRIPVFSAIAAVAIGFTPASLFADESPTTFERVFGVPGEFDATMVEKVKSLPPGERLFVDVDGDGKNDEVWFIDTAARHTAPRRPILVRVIDEDGDLDETGPDLDSDLYLADWHADGIVDGVIDYQDNDGDGDVDEMGIYFGEYQKPWLDKNRVKVWWSQDVGDDNLLWYDVDWNYHQAQCQYRTHFSGDEVFYQFALTKDSAEWLNVFEDPFAFYDPDGDSCSEVVMRICAVGHDVSSLRYSIDVDNDAHGRHTHDYDFSITALPGENAITTNDDITASFRLRGIPVHPVLPWKNARKFARRAPWAKALLTWDEMNANTEADIRRDPHERWEGIINHASADFPQVGGPPCSKFNKRIEIARPPARPLRLYYDATDHRLHLLGAAEGWLHVDADLDGKVDARYTYLDDDGDGIFDRRQLDLDADGQVDFDWKMQGRDVREFRLEFGPLCEFYRAELDRTLADSQIFIDAAKAALGDQLSQDPAETFYLTALAAWTPATELGERMRKTPAGARFYLDLIRDRLFLALNQRFRGHAQWNDVLAAYQAGDYRIAAASVKKLGGSGDSTGVKSLSQDPKTPTPNPSPEDGGGGLRLGNLSPEDGGGELGIGSKSRAAFRSFTRRIPLPIDNQGKGRRDDWPVVLAVREIRKMAPDFSPDHCAIVAPERWIDWRQIPHQIDEIDPTIGKELSFLVDVPADSQATYYLYYAPAAAEATEFPRRTGAAEDWLPPNIGWESNRCAYRAYWGQFDFFGKKTEQLIFGDIGGKSYHQEVEWGIDALHVGKTSGLGGLTLRHAGLEYPIRNPAGNGDIDFKKRIVVQGPIRSVIEMVAKNVIPSEADVSIRLLCLIYAEHQESEIRAHVTGVDGKFETTLEPGIVKLSREAAFADTECGCFGAWGWQEDGIGQVGMGVIVSPDVVKGVRDEPEERRIQCKTSADGRLRYWIVGDWRRGRQYAVAPTVENWRRELRDLSDRLLDDVDVKIGHPEILEQ